MQPCQPPRNQVIAHNDLTASQARFLGNNPVCGPSRADVNEVLKHIAELMNAVDNHHESNTTGYDTSQLPDPGDGETLALYLELLDRHMGYLKQEEHRRLLQG